mgnify:FL=1
MLKNFNILRKSFLGVIYLFIYCFFYFSFCFNFVKADDTAMDMYYFSINTDSSLNYFVIDNINRLHLEVNKDQNPFIILANAFENSGIYLDSDYIKKLKVINFYVSKTEKYYLIKVVFEDKSFNSKVNSSFDIVVIMDSIRAIRDFRGAKLSKGFPVYTYFKRQFEFFKLCDIYNDFQFPFFFYSFDNNFNKLVINRKDIVGYEFEFSIYPVKLEAHKNFICYSIKPENDKVIMEFKISKDNSVSQSVSGSNYVNYSKFLNDNANKFFNQVKQGVFMDSYKRRMLVNSLYAMDFLVNNKKMLAGSWRYLTYFGRDTIITSLLLNDITNSNFLKVAVSSVLDRMNSKGEVSPEEDLGLQAQYDHLVNIDKEGKKIENLNILSVPVYDYKMKDDDFMFPILLNRYLLKLKKENKEQEISNFLDNEMYLTKTVTNMEYILNKLQECLDKDEPVKVDETHLVGDWRDSPEGLGYGIYPNSINLGLVIASLYSIKQNIKIFKTVYPKIYNYINNKKYIDNLELVDDLIIKWKTQIYPKFKVHVPSDKLRNKLIKYLSTFDKEERDFYLNQKINDNFTIRDFIEGRVNIELDFYALALDKNMKLIEVINSDISFMLFF